MVNLNYLELLLLILAHVLNIKPKVITKTPIHSTLIKGNSYAFSVIKLERDADSTILINDVYDMFKGWYTNSYNDKKPPARKKLKEYFDNNNFEVISNNKGIIIKGIRGKDQSLVDISEFDNNL